ncbi:general secretion pathway protein [Pseudomonas veronii]|uniref:general secretion pathway protein n=1 Tax=Pseudomonas veronii TaxID=76761 RepID=UPI0015A1D1B3|nr:general secretion pathway protein [Pseudomonas veronii]NWD56720.1 general secretion pathway protein [Pseudomonas veronii]
MAIRESLHKIKSYFWSKLGINSASTVSLDTRIAAFLFRSKRADYYYYLADVIEGTKGKKSLLDIFLSDAKRYKTSARGKLSLHWATQFDRCGGSLSKTFQTTLPDEDVAALEALQESGGETALESALRDLAANTELVSKAKSIVITTSAVAIACLAMLMVFVIMMPTYIVPKLIAAFSMLPPEYYPSSAASLFSLADFVGDYWALIVFLFVAFIYGCTWSLSNVTGRTRAYLDKYGMAWGLYRDFQSIRFLSFLAAMIKRRGNESTVLLDAVEMQTIGASRWKRYHIDLMLQYIKRGSVGPELFATGIMDKTMEWYIADLIEARGFEDALEFVRDRLKERVLKKITTQSVIISWVVLMSSILLSSWLMFWQMAVIEDMRKALQMFLAQ